MKHKELIALGGAGILIGLVMGIATKNLALSLRVLLSYFVLYYFPVLPWVMLIKGVSLLERFAIINVSGLAFIPLVYFMLGSIGMPLNTFTFLAVPLVIGLIGFIFYFKNNGASGSNSS